MIYTPRKLESKLIALSLSGGLPKIKSAGVNPDKLIVYPNVLKFIVNYERKYTSLPNKDLILQKFPDFKFSAIDGVNENFICDQVLDNAIKRDAVKIVDIGIDQIRNADGNAIEIVRGVASKLIALQKPQINISYADASSRRRLKEFDKRKKTVEKGAIIGIRTGLPPLDSSSVGWVPGDLVIVFGPPEVGKCAAIDTTTVVDTKTGKRIPLADVTTSNSIAALDESSLKEVSQNHPIFVDNGMKKVWGVTTRSGRYIEVTKSHPFYSISGWRKLSNLRSGDYVAVPRELPYFGDLHIEEYKLRILGNLIGDGFVGYEGISSSEVSLSNEDEKIVKRFAASVRKFGDTYIESRNAIRPKVRQTGINQYTKDSYEPANAVKWLMDIGVHGKRSPDKFLPDFVFEMDKESTCILLASLWDTDGEVNSGRIGYATTSDRLREQVAHLLLKLGIITRSTYTKNLIEITKFKQMVAPYMVGDKKIRLDSLVGERKSALEKCNREPCNYFDVFPKEAWEIISGERPEAFTKRSHQPAGKVGNWLDTRGLTRNTMQFWADRYGSDVLNRLANSDILWDRIESIRYVGIKRVGDLGFKKHHNFVANDFFIHNSLVAEFFGIIAWLDSKKVLYISPEMTVDEVELRWDNIAAKFFGYSLPAEDLLAGSKLYRSKYRKWLTELGGMGRKDWMTVDNVNSEPFSVAVIEGLADEFKPEVIVVDSLPLLESTDGTLGISWDALLNIGYGLKSLASRKNYVIIATNPSTGSTFDNDDPSGMEGIAFSRAGLPFAASVMISIAKDKDIRYRKLRVAKKRRGKPVTDIIRMKIDKGTVEVV
jgi:intein/homing endonuclease